MITNASQYSDMYSPDSGTARIQKIHITIGVQYGFPVLQDHGRIAMDTMMSAKKRTQQENRVRVKARICWPTVNKVPMCESSLNGKPVTGMY